jgi:uncharacterized protein (TIGR03435 family)
MRRILALSALIVCFSSLSLPAQNAVSLPTFEVATIRLNHSDSPLEDTRMPPGRFTATNASLRSLIAAAYHLPRNQIGVIPEELEKLHFDIQAKMSEEQYAEIEHLGTRSRERQVELMLQSLLAERFKLVVSHHPDERKVLALVVAKGGAKLTPAGTFTEAHPRPSTGPRSFSGTLLSDQDIELHDFADRLSETIGSPVVDQTGLTGSYDILFEVPIAQDEDSEAAIVSELEDQLGLALKRQFATVDTIWVDRVEEPSGN